VEQHSRHRADAKYQRYDTLLAGFLQRFSFRHGPRVTRQTHLTQMYFVPVWIQRPKYAENTDCLNKKHNITYHIPVRYLYLSNRAGELTHTEHWGQLGHPNAHPDVTKGYENLFQVLTNCKRVTDFALFTPVTLRAPWGWLQVRNLYPSYWCSISPKNDIRFLFLLHMLCITVDLSSTM